jgi:hypothetical protein
MDLIAFVGAVVGAILINLIASELFAWGPRLSEWLMRCAVQRLVPGMQERMREEWAGHLQAIPPGLSRIVVAAGFLIASLPFSSAARVGVSTDKLPTPERLEEIKEEEETLAPQLDWLTGYDPASIARRYYQRESKF